MPARSTAAHRPALLAAAAVAVGALAIGGASPAPVAATSPVPPPRTPTPTAPPKRTPTPTTTPTPTPVPLPTGPPACRTGAGADGERPATLRRRVLTHDGVVEVRGTRTLLTVESCVGRNALPAQEWALVKAPRTRRWAAVRTMVPVRNDDGTISFRYLDRARPRTERQFDRLLGGPLLRLSMPGVRGTVLAEHHDAVQLLATRRNGRPVTERLRFTLAVAYLKTAGIPATAGRGYN